MKYWFIDKEIELSWDNMTRIKNEKKKGNLWRRWKYVFTISQYTYQFNHLFLIIFLP